MKISNPSEVTAIECSNCAESERSRVVTVQPSCALSLVSALPILIMGSTVKNMPSSSRVPVAGRPAMPVLLPSVIKH